MTLQEHVSSAVDVGSRVLEVLVVLLSGEAVEAVESVESVEAGESSSSAEMDDSTSSDVVVEDAKIGQ